MSDEELVDSLLMEADAYVATCAYVSYAVGFRHGLVNMDGFSAENLDTEAFNEMISSRFNEFWKKWIDGTKPAEIE